MADDDLAFSCPRCGGEVRERFYGPCSTCREGLNLNMQREGHDMDPGRYEPVMHVVPHQVATKD
jgi:hypothetical protein